LKTVFSPGLEVEGLSISNPDGFSGGDFLVADKAAFRIKLMPLLNRDYEIDTVELSGATLNLVVDADGVNNWSSLTGSAGVPVEDPGPGQVFTFNQIIISGVAIDEVQVNYVDQLDGRTLSASNINLNIPELVYGEPLDLAMSFQLSSTNPDIESDISLSSIVTYDLENNIYALENLALDFLDSRLEADLSSNDGNINGSINFSSENAGELLDLFDQPELAEHIDDIHLMVYLDGNADLIQLYPFDLNLNVSGSPLISPTNLHFYTNAEIDIEDKTSCSMILVYRCSIYS